MSDAIKKKFFLGMAWTFVQNIVVRGLGVIFAVFLARLLMPEDYGLVGMLSIFIAISEVFIQSGFGQALIQKEDCSDEDFSTAFYFNVIVSIIIYGVLFVSAPFIADFYQEPQLTTITRVLSLNFILGSFNIVQQSKLAKAMIFKPLALISLISTVVGGIVGLAMAYLGYGVWSLVFQTLSSTFLRVIVFPLFTKWHPNRPFNLNSFLHLWNFGSKILVAGFIDVIIVNFSNIILGRFYNKEQVGYFSKARGLADLPAMTMSSVLGTVLFPLLSEIQKDESRHTAVFKKVCFNTVLFTFPLMILLALLAKPIIILLFTNKWAAMIPLFQALVLARMFLPLNVVNANMLQSKGQTKLFMQLYFITSPLSLIAITVSIPFGVKAMAWATFISNLFYYSFFAYVICKKIGYSFFELLWDWRLIFLSLMIMTLGVSSSIHWIGDLWLQLVIGLLVGMSIYIICCKTFNLVDDTIKKIIFSKIKHFKQ